MTTAVSPHINEFLSQTLVGVISTIDTQGRPRSAPIWYQWEDGAAYFFTGRGTLKWRNLLRDPHTSLCVDWREPPYKSVIVDGTIEEVDRPLYDLVLSMATRYYGEEEGRHFAEGYREDNPGVVIFRLIPTSVADYTSTD
ncbi:MAG: TIGR03618 family F420-dependent PPOX class oxidoreductase [Dehalococcoidia bacterium]|nr:TIGR03618 family F420-dependent PPOX class oxidoreductase [Dehalococcoidia bacterium]